MGGYTVNSTVIKKDIEELFLIINNIENWPGLHDYKSAELIERKKLVDGKIKIRFRLASNEEDEDGDDPKTWVSQRILDRKKYSARGVRLEPLYPFKHWILDILLTPEAEGTRMTWIQDFAIDPKTGHTDEEIEGYINKGSVEELEHFKNKIESGEVKNKLDESFFE
jgi:aromatase